ncbi:Zn-ribbon domain-containing protein [Halobaculum marinum]|uniref:Zn-ribbon domain-containing protein n=1 Tax=Halobaculum marinum TaxID=3031996 RepID=A0ABD5X085_9EURY|nr:Zn-ribbon containing protein [Halobaculum sp. DT55]
MPHQCTNCGRTFADGSKEMLSGCPDCGGNKFQFRPAGSTDQSSGAGAAEQPSTPSQSTATPESTRSDAPPETVADRAGAPDQSPTPDQPTPTERSSTPASTGNEDGAQASARSEVVSEDEIAAAAPEQSDTSPTDEVDAGADAPAPDESADEESVDPNLDALRQKLNDQFESIRIVSPGQYELNLMELYDREEYIISLREDGRYVIEMPEGWDDR